LQLKKMKEQQRVFAQDSSVVQPSRHSTSGLHEYLNVPNLVTLFRLLLGLAATGVVYAIAIPNRFEIAAAMLLSATLMDFFDGYLARRLGSVTRFGAVWDPLADKIVANVFFCVLVDFGVFEWWFVGLALARDLAVQAGRIRAAFRGLVIRTFRVSDTRNGIQIAAVVIGLLSLSTRPNFLSVFSKIFSLAGAARTLFVCGLALGYIGLVVFFVAFWRASHRSKE
jgi:CDP-diacylglycerol---glycerol-3-phosphate 3-phosphatidyltransferase